MPKEIYKWWLIDAIIIAQIKEEEQNYVSMVNKSYNFGSVIFLFPVLFCIIHDAIYTNVISSIVALSACQSTFTIHTGRAAG